MTSAIRMLAELYHSDRARDSDFASSIMSTLTSGDFSDASPLDRPSADIVCLVLSLADER